MNDLSRFKTLIFVAFALIISACQSQYPLPGKLQTNGIVQVGLGGIKRNFPDGKALTGADIAAEIKDDTGVWQQMKVVGLFRAYPDNTSTYALETLDRDTTTNPFWSELEPYDGMWWATLRVQTPAGVPLVLNPGAATLRINSAELVSTGWEYEGDLATGIPVEIIAGTATVSNDELQQYSSYRHARVLTVKPDDLTGVTEVGGLQIKMTYNIAALTGFITPRFVPYSHDPNINIIQHTVDNGDGTRSLIAMVTNPASFVPASDTTSGYVDGSSTFADLQFAVVLKDATTLADGWTANYWLETADSYFIDANGDVIASVTPVLDRSF